MHITVEPSILYLGTPVVLLTTQNIDGTPNIAPMSSAWWLGWNCMLGLGAKGHTAANLLREKECVINLPSIHQVDAVNRLARTTGSSPVPPYKLAMGYRHEKLKFDVAHLTPTASELISPPRIAECPIQLEAILETSHPFGHRPDKEPGCIAFEVRIVRAHVDTSLLLEGRENRIDPNKWRPILMSFCQFYGLTDQLRSSALAKIPETAYRPAPHMGR